MKKKTFIAALLGSLVPFLPEAGAAALDFRPDPDPMLTCQKKNPGTFRRFDFTERTVVAIEDQPGRMPGSLFKSIDSRKGAPSKKFYSSSINVFLVKDKKSGKLFLIDAGYGRTSSRLLPLLEGAGIGPEMISGVFITHIHPDHVGGLTRPDGRIAFPQAKVYIARKEYEAWKNDPNRVGLAKHLTPCEKNLVLVDFGKEIAGTGLTPLLYPGHTPGHTVFDLKTGAKGERVTFVGDIVHAAELQLRAPSYCARFDMDPRTAVESRKKLLERGGRWFGAHIPFPGQARIATAPAAQKQR